MLTGDFEVTDIGVLVEQSPRNCSGVSQFRKSIDFDRDVQPFFIMGKIIHVNLSAFSGLHN